MSYDEIKKELQHLPMTWYPELLRVMITAAIAKGVFLPGGATRWVDVIEKSIGREWRATLVETKPFHNSQGDMCGLCDGTTEHNHPQLQCPRCGMIGLAENMIGHTCDTILINGKHYSKQAIADKMSEEWEDK